MLMAKYAFKYYKIIWINMTFRAQSPGTLVPSGIYRKVLSIMVPGSLSPVAAIMAVLALSRKSGGYMIGICGAVIIIGMTGITVGWRAGISIGMTIYTLQG